MAVVREYSLSSDKWEVYSLYNKNARLPNKHRDETLRTRSLVVLIATPISTVQKGRDRFDLAAINMFAISLTAGRSRSNDNSCNEIRTLSKCSVLRANTDISVR